MKVKCLGIKIDDVSINQVIEQVKEWLGKAGKYYIVTPNPEIVMMAQKDLELKRIINQADLSIPDGIGLKFATDIENTSPGIDTLEALVKMAAEKGFTTGFLGGRDEVAKKAAECLKKKYPNLKVSFASGDMEVDKEGREVRIMNHESSRGKHDSNRLILKTDLLFVAFGPPKQEKWIAKNLDKILVKVAMGVGGSFDYLSGKVPRAPVILRKIGFEWLFRLIVQPWRIKRQLSLIKYIWLLTESRLNGRIKE